MLKKNKQDPDIYSNKNGYFKNPAAIDLLKSISGERFTLMINWQTVGILMS